MEHLIVYTNFLPNIDVLKHGNNNMSEQKLPVNLPRQRTMCVP